MQIPVSRYIFLVAFCLFASLHMQAQFLDYGSDPARFKWNIVKLPHYNLVYPLGNDSMAYNYALYLENAYPHLQKTIGTGMSNAIVGPLANGCTGPRLVANDRGAGLVARGRS